MLKSNPDCFRLTLQHIPIATPQVQDSAIFAMINIYFKRAWNYFECHTDHARLRTPSVSLCQFCDVAKVAVIHRKI